MKKHRNSSVFRNANYRVPDSLTSLVIEGVNSLPKINRKVEYLQETFLTKYVSKDTAPGKVRRQRAINKWLAVDRENEATDTRLINYPRNHQILPGVTRSVFEDTVRHFILAVIGDTPPNSILKGGFSGGASTSKKRGESFPAVKYVGQAHITADALHLGDLVFRDSPMWHRELLHGQLSVEEVPGNVMFTVPKSTEIDRCACKEPDLNMYIQRGIGLAIRAALRRVGINLNDQSVNRSLARLGSIDGSLATLDLSSASDSISYGFVAEFLPPLWFSCLDAVRSKKTRIDGEWYAPHMFSSMGNGFTFELESLLFYALARASAYHLGVRGRISVYGDDIIVPVIVANYLEYVLEFYGFSVNREKSFSSGPFRESCGGHYLSGYDITPFYLRKPIERVQDLILFMNNLRLWDTRNGEIGVITEDLWRSLAPYVDDRLHGGYESLDGTASTLSLLSPSRGQSYTLSPIKREHPTTLGHYLMWLDTNDDRVGPLSEMAVGDVTTSSVYRLRKRASWDIGQLRSHYYGDVLNYSQPIGCNSGG